MQDCPKPVCFPKGDVMTRKGVRSACTVFAIAAPERAELSYEKNFTLDSEYKLMVINLSSSPISTSMCISRGACRHMGADRTGVPVHLCLASPNSVSICDVNESSSCHHDFVALPHSSHSHT